MRCLAEWMVQPIMASLLGLGFSDRCGQRPRRVCMAAGPFMLFRRSTYERIGRSSGLGGRGGGSGSGAADKADGYRLRYLLGLDALDLRMYADLSALWEGWTKNWFLGLTGIHSKHRRRRCGAADVQSSGC